MLQDNGHYHSVAIIFRIMRHTAKLVPHLSVRLKVLSHKPADQTWPMP